MKLLCVLFLSAVSLFAQNPKPCTNVVNTATAGQVLSANGSGSTPPCKWIAAGGGGGGGTVTSLTATGPIVITPSPTTTTGVISCPTCGTGNGTVTSVGLAGTTNQITVTGSTPITGAGSWTLSLPSTLVLPNGTTATTQSAADNSTKVATTAYVDTAGGSFVPTSRTISTTAPLGGGGALSSNLTLTCTGCLTSAVTSIATTSPITGGTITTTGTIACSTCVVASSPGVGIAHFAGSTQTVTSSAVALGGADVSGVLPGLKGGGLVLVEQHSASTSASLDFTTCISSSYDEYQIELLNIVPATDNTTLRFRISTDGGSNYVSTTSYSWASWAWDTSFSGQGGGAGVTFIQLGSLGASSTASNGGMSAQFILINPANSAGNKHLFGQVAGNNASGSGLFASASFSGSYNLTTAVNAFQILMSSGNITSGTVRCYGIAKT